MRGQDKTKEQAAMRKTSEKPQSVKVGEILMEMGCLTKSQLDKALQKQKEADMRGESHIPVGRILVQSGAITEEHLRTALAEQLKRIDAQYE